MNRRQRDFPAGGCVLFFCHYTDFFLCGHKWVKLQSGEKPSFCTQRLQRVERSSPPLHFPYSLRHFYSTFTHTVGEKGRRAEPPLPVHPSAGAAARQHTQEGRPATVEGLEIHRTRCKTKNKHMRGKKEKWLFLG